MFQTQNSKKYDLEDRTFDFTRDIRNCLKQINKTIASVEDIKQLVRSSGSVAANYIEANEALSKKDFAMRIKICRKEAKESKLWLRLLASESVTNPTIDLLRKYLRDEIFRFRASRMRNEEAYWLKYADD